MASAFSRTFWVAMYTAVPPTEMPRLPKVPMPLGTTAVSPCSTATSSMGTPSSSETICAKVVSSPWPWGDTPVSTVVLPVKSRRTVPLSQPPAGSAAEGPMAQIST